MLYNSFLPLLIIPVLLGCSSPKELDNECKNYGDAMLPSRMYAVSGDSLQVTIIDEYTGDVLQEALVTVNFDSDRGAVSDVDGTVRLPASPGDTLRVDFIGLQTEWVVVPLEYDSLVVILGECRLISSHPPQ